VFARGFLFAAVSFGQALILPRPSTKIDIFSIQRNAQSPETRKTSFARHCGTCSLWYCVNPSIVSDVGRSLEKEGRIMSDANSRLNSSEVGDITKQLNDGRLSRHGLRERLMGLGIGFGAAFVLGLAGAQASSAPEATVALKSSNPAINAIIDTGPQTEKADAKQPLQQEAWYRRWFHRWYHRW
jgi:hypothetical protein